MENKENKDESCCATEKKGKCCGGKAVCVAVLLLIGGLVGFCMGNCNKGKSCLFKSKPAVEQSAVPSAAPSSEQK